MLLLWLWKRHGGKIVHLTKCWCDAAVSVLNLSLMPHQKSTVLSVCFIYQRSVYLEAIVIEHYRLSTYFSGIVPSIRKCKWVNWYADCPSLKPFQNQLCHWFSAGTCISFLNAMCCSARVRWGQTHAGPVPFFIQAELPLTSREILPESGLQAEHRCFYRVLFVSCQVCIGYTWTQRRLCFLLLSSAHRFVFCLLRCQNTRF